MIKPSINTTRADFNNLGFTPYNNTHTLHRHSTHINIDKQKKTITFHKVQFKDISKIFLQSDRLGIENIQHMNYPSEARGFKIIFANCLFDKDIEFSELHEFNSCIFRGVDVKITVTQVFKISNCVFENASQVTLVNSKRNQPSLLSVLNCKIFSLMIEAEVIKIKNCVVEGSFIVKNSNSIVIDNVDIKTDINLTAKDYIKVNDSTLNSTILSTTQNPSQEFSLYIDNTTIEDLKIIKAANGIEIRSSEIRNVNFDSLVEREITILKTEILRMEANHLRNIFYISDTKFTDLILEDIQKDDLKLSIFEFIRGSIDNLKILNSHISCKFYINKQYKKNKGITNITCLDIDNTVFEENFKLHNTMVGTINIDDTDFEKNADFFQSVFKQGSMDKDKTEDIKKNDIGFTAINFRKLALFGDTVFEKKVILKYVTFEGYSHFRRADFRRGLDLDYSNIQEEMNFFGVKNLDSEHSKERTSQETYRIIKHNFEELDNKIESNDFHSLELYKKGKDLSKEVKRNKSVIPEWLTFKLHHNVSAHSTNWLLTLHWIITTALLGALLGMFSKLGDINGVFTLITFAMLTVTFVALNRDNDLTMFYPLWVFIVILATYYKRQYPFMEFLETGTEHVFEQLNIISVNDPNSFSFIVKLTLSYLYYQFIVAIRKDTRK